MYSLTEKAIARTLDCVFIYPSREVNRLAYLMCRAAREGRERYGKDDIEAVLNNVDNMLYEFKFARFPRSKPRKLTKRQRLHCAHVMQALLHANGEF